MRRTAALLVLLFTLTPALSGAQALDPASADALAAALKMLSDPAQRSAAISGNPQAGAIDQQIRGLAGSEALMQEFYALASEVFADLARGTGGDATKMLEALDRGRTDPAGFAAMLSPQTLERLHQLSVKIGDQRR